MAGIRGVLGLTLKTHNAPYREIALNVTPVLPRQSISTPRRILIQPGLRRIRAFTGVIATLIRTVSVRTLSLFFCLICLSARSVMGQSPLPPVAACKAPAGVFGSIQKMDVSMEGKIFLLPNKPENPYLVALKDFDSLPSTGSIYADKWDIPSRSFTEGFPGVTGRFEWFSLTYQGSIYIPAPGSYGFRLSSDDGSQLFLDDSLVIDNDGVHSMRDKSAAVTLKQGNHTFRLRYFQGPAAELGLQLFVKEPGAKEKIFALQDFDQKVLDSRRRLHVTEDAHAIHIRLGAEVLFDSGKSQLRPEATASLQQLAEVLLGEPGFPVLIEGHTDNVGSAQLNQALSAQRADAVKQWLSSDGKVTGGCISTKGFGAAKPVASNASDAGRQKNRRVEIRIEKGRMASGAPPTAGRSRR
jgi:outer membrane protein OmpA-like peptidoglycan-associated protein